MKADLFLANGTIATDYGVFSGGVAVKDGKIWQLIEGSERVISEETIDLKGKIVIPGLVDDHVHFNDPGRGDWEGYEAGAYAAAAGGVTTAFDMPINSIPVTTTSQRLLEKRDFARDKLVVDIGSWCLVDNSNINELEKMRAEGIVGLKAFTKASEAGAGFGWFNNGDLYLAMKEIEKLGLVLALHAEDNSLVAAIKESLVKAGRKDNRAWAEARPPFEWVIQIEAALILAEETNAILHILHAGTPKELDAILRAKARGVNVTSETCPHYLALDEDDLERIGPVAVCIPPVQPRRTVDELWKYVLSGRVDIIGSDHCPCSIELKERGNDDILKSWPGLNSVQTMLPVLLTEGVHRRGLDLTALVRMTSLNPAKRFGVYPLKGNLLPGADADMVVIDPERKWVLHSEDLHSMHKISPFIGRTFKGIVEQTFVRGQPVYNQGEIIVKPGYGKIIKRVNRSHKMFSKIL